SDVVSTRRVRVLESQGNSLLPRPARRRGGDHPLSAPPTRETAGPGGPAVFGRGLVAGQPVRFGLAETGVAGAAVPAPPAPPGPPAPGPPRTSGPAARHRDWLRMTSPVAIPSRLSRTCT